MPRFLRPEDVVVMPSGRRAQVRSISEDGMCLVNYIDGEGSLRARAVTLHERLLRRIVPGREQPAPVRIDRLGRMIA